MPARRTLSAADLNRALLARQLLLERSRLSIPRALERIGGLQAQYAPSMYIGLWSRVRELGREQLTSALERRTVVQGTLLRSTIHLVSARDYWPIALAVREPRRQWYLRTNRRGPDARQLAAGARRLRARLAAGPMHRSEIEQLLTKPVATYVGLWLDLVRVPPSGTWEKRRAHLYAAAEQWLGPPTGTPEDGVELLVRRYLAAFGPATPRELANWAGLPASSVVPVLGRLALRRLCSDRGEQLLDLPGAALPGPATPAPVRFLPTFDATLLAHARRTGILPEAYRARIFNSKMPQSVPTFLIDGAVAGTWRYHEGTIVTEPFAPLSTAVRRELAEEAQWLAAFHG